MKNILVLCTGNSCRSQMAQGYLQQFTGDKAAVYSAGVEIHGLNPFAIGIMAEDGVDISRHTSNHVDEYAGIDFDYVITVCDHANESCPVFMGETKKLHHNFPDPSKKSGTAKELVEAFRATRNEIRAFCREFVQVEMGLTINGF